MPRLILLNGAPGSGKSTIARLFAERNPLTLAFSIDELKHALGRWEEDPTGAKVHARALGVALIREQLALGRDVVLAQYVVGAAFLDELASEAGDVGAAFHELVLVLPPQALAGRLAERSGDPARTCLEINTRPVRPEDAADLAASIDTMLRDRPRAERIDATGSIEDTLARAIAIFEAPADDDE